MPTISTGLHIVRKRLTSGDRYYVYARRGGPLIAKVDGRKPAITPDLLDKAFAARQAPQRRRDTLDALLDLYRASNDFAKLSDSTQTSYRLWLDRISERFGKVPLALAGKPEMRAEIIAWRDEWGAMPRSADMGVGTLGTVLQWGLDRGLVSENRARGIKHLHRVNRADLIWEPRHWEAVQDISPQVHRVLVLASLTGLRQGDLLRLSAEQVHPTYIATTTRKTGGEAVIPMHAELADALRGPHKGVILRNSLGEPWTTSGFKSSWAREQPEGFDRSFHDLRGTFVTRLVLAGMADSEIAEIIGWRTERIAAIRARYVDRARVAKARAERI